MGAPGPLLPNVVVVDASVAAKWLLPEPYSAEAMKLLSGSVTLHVPDLIFLEVGNILWKRVRGGEITTEKAKELLEWLVDLPLVVHESLPLVSHALEIACQYDRAVYDCIYIALALTEGCKLVLADEKLCNALASTPLSAALLPVQNL